MKARIIATLLVLLLTGLPAGAQTQADETPSVRLQALLGLAAYNLENGETEAYQIALIAALQIVTQHPTSAPRTRHAEIMFALADSLSNQQLMFAEAKVLYDQSIQILTDELGPDHIRTLDARARRLQAKDLEIQANVSLQRPASQLALWDGTEEGKKPSPEDLGVLRRLARAYEETGTPFEAHAAHLRYAFYLAEAEQFDLALRVVETRIAVRDEDIRKSRNPDPELDFRLADAYGTALLKSGRFAAAAAAFSNGTEALLLHLRGTQWTGGPQVAGEAHLQGQVYGELYASAALRALQSDGSKRSQLTQSAFRAMQLAGYGPASAAVARAMTQKVSEDPNFIEQAAELQREVLSGASPDPDRLRSRLTAEFARYFEWQIPAPVALSEVQETLLGPDEALITVLPATTQSAGADAVNGLVLAVTQEGAVLVELPLGWAQMVQDIVALHQTLDPKAPAQIAALRAPLASVQEGSAPARLSAPFAFGAAARLYQAFFAQLEVAQLIGAKPVWTLVPYGETLGIPFAALIVDGPSDATGNSQWSALQLRQARWLGHERALRVVPSVHALRNLRTRPVQQTAPGRLAYVGIGAPEFSGEQLAALPNVDTIMRGSASDRVAAIRTLPPLPGTRREIETLASVFGEDRSKVRIGADANERQLQLLAETGDLEKAGIVHFATHGLLTGAFEGLHEPALALTPGSEVSESDGLLTASEAAQLRLNAEWVILSACDTAGEDSFGGEGLGGLVQGFLAAGARNVLASHWRVDDVAAERLITRTVILSEQGSGKAEALRRAMLELAQDDTRDQTVLPNSHPSVWAPFLMIGGG